MTDCPRCQGFGSVNKPGPKRRKQLTPIMPCPNCDGSGKDPERIESEEIMNKPYAGMVGEKVEDAISEALNNLEELREIAEQEFQKHLDDSRFHAILHSFDAAAYALQHGRSLLRMEPFTDRKKDQAIASMEAAKKLAHGCKKK